ncbi:MAG: glycosyltransferase family 4 protein [Candidatus Andersenbacteria bacterium]|nr:glycosyltransferase family 4 protein [Candidatus Andersenbacteria bacterium]
MKIAIDINELTLKQETGVKVYTREIVSALGKIDKKNEYILYANCREQKFLFPTADNLTLKTIRSTYPFWTYTKLSQELKKDKPDILFMPIQSVPFFKKPKNIKIVVTVHDLAFMIFPNHFTAKDRFLLKFHTKRAIQMADKIIAPSEATKKDIIKFYKTDANKIKVIYHGVKAQNCSSSVIERKADAAIPRLSTQNYNIKPYDTNNGIATVVPLPRNDNNNDNPYILFVGTIQPRKNLIRLIEAFEIIKSRRNESMPNLKLVIAGGKGWMASKTYKKAKKSKFSEDIIFRGKVSSEDLVKLYQNALMFVLPSLYEGFGLPVLEAMSYGVPCVVSDNSSLSEIVDDHALLVNAKSSDDIAQKISMFLNNDFLRKDFAQRSLENIKEFSWEKAAKETLEVFESV